jgi:hypothetical protein
MSHDLLRLQESPGGIPLGPSGSAFIPADFEFVVRWWRGWDKGVQLETRRRLRSWPCHRHCAHPNASGLMDCRTDIRKANRFVQFFEVPLNIQ